MTLDSVLSGVGKTIFIEHYYDFKNKSREDCIASFMEDFSDKPKRNRTSHAQRIFREGKEKEALKLILSSDKVDVVTQGKAKDILEREM